MAVTLSHPAAAIPLRRLGFLFSPLVVGSISPDFEFFLSLTCTRWFIGHTVPGIFIFCVPAGLVVLWIFHSLLKLPLVSLLPRKQQMRLLPLCGTFRFFPLRRLAMIVLSLIAGAVTHLVWDSLTHHDGWVVQHLLSFAAPLFGLSQGVIVRAHILLQYISSVFGIVLMVIWFLRWQKRTPLAEDVAVYRIAIGHRAATAVSMIVVSAVGGTARGFIAIPELSGLPMVKSMVTNGIIGCGTCFILAAILFGIVWRMGGVVKGTGAGDGARASEAETSDPAGRPVPARKIAGNVFVDTDSASAAM